MKIYTGYPGGITKITNDKGFYQTEDLANVISVYVNQADVTGITYTLALEFLRADGRKTTLIPQAFEVGDDTTLTEDGVTYDIHNFVLTDSQLAVAGTLAFTCYITIFNNSNVVVSRGALFNAVSNVRKTVTYSANTIFVVSEDEDDVPIIVADMKTAIETLAGQLASKVNKADVADNLTTNDSDKVLSAKQGYVLKAVLDTMQAELDSVEALENLNNIVGTYSELESLITVGEPTDYQLNAKVQVLNDSTHDNNSTLYNLESLDIINGLVDNYTWRFVGYYDGYNKEQIDEIINDFEQSVTDNFNELSGQLEGALTEQDEKIESLGTLQPSGTDTTANITSKTAPDGIWISTTDGHWYYWNGTNYVSGGEYLSVGNVVTHDGNQLQDENGNDIYPYTDDKEIYSSIDALNNSSQEIIEGWTKPSNKYLTVVDVTTVDINNPATAQTSTDFQYVIVECKEGDKFIVNGYDGLNMRSWTFTDESYNILSKSIYNNGNQNHRYIVAPVDAKYLIIQRRLTLNHNPSYKNINLPNDYYNNLFEYGGINQTGVLSTATDRLRSIDFISDNIEYIETSSNTWAYSLWVRFYDANGDIDSSFGNTYNVNYINFDELRALYPTYKFKLVLRLDQLGDTPFNNIYIKFKNTFVENKERTLYESKNNYKNLMFYPYKFKMEAHRGLSNVYPQNTLKAFIGAGEQDFIYGIETDVQMTSDNVLVCFHDDTLDALTTGTGAVSSYTWENLQNVVYDNTPGSTTYPNETIPKFEDYLKVCRKYGKVPYIEIKNLDMNGIKYLVELVRKMGFVNRCVFTSFNLNHIKYLSYLAKNDFFIEYMVNYGTTIATAISQAKPYNVNALRFNYADITEELVNTAHENNYLIDCWGLNVGNTTAYDNLIECGAEGCTCDNWEWAD